MSLVPTLLKHMSKIKNSNILSIKEQIPEIELRLDYAIKENFTGDIVPGYSEKIAYLTREAIQALALAHKKFISDGYNIIVFDAYRPLSSVHYFYQQWRLMKDVESLKKYYYPAHSKEELFEIGYLSKRSSHCRASTIDMGLIELKSKKLVDFGTPFDFFGEKSHTFHQDLSKDIIDKRMYFINVMKQANFKNYDKEWWHFTLNNEPYPDTYFDFEIKEYNE